MYMYTIINEESLDSVLSQGLTVTQSSLHRGNIQHPVWLMGHATVPLVTNRDHEVFEMLFQGKEAVFDTNGNVAFAYEGAVGLKLRLRYADQVRTCCASDFEKLTLDEPLWNFQTRAYESSSRNFLVATTSILPNQIIGASMWSSDKAGWAKIPTGRQLVRHVVLQEKTVGSTVSYAA